MAAPPVKWPDWDDVNCSVRSILLQHPTAGSSSRRRHYRSTGNMQGSFLVTRGLSGYVSPHQKAIHPGQRHTYRSLPPSDQHYGSRNRDYWKKGLQAQRSQRATDTSSAICRYPSMHWNMGILVLVLPGYVRLPAPTQISGQTQPLQTRRMAHYLQFSDALGFSLMYLREISKVLKPGVRHLMQSCLKFHVMKRTSFLSPGRA